MKKRFTFKGFTLIELLVVIAIIGILVAIGTASYITASKQSRDTKRKADLEQIRQALETYRSENGVYPDDTAGTDALKPNYISTVPVNPGDSAPYSYDNTSTPTSNTYTLCATLETITTPSTCNWIVTNPWQLN